MRRFMLAISILLLFGSEAMLGQLPRTSNPLRRQAAIREYLKSAQIYHLVTVDSGGAADYTDLSEALAYVASQTPTASSRWTVIVYPGNFGSVTGNYSYTEDTLTIPSYVSVQGATHPVIEDGQAYGMPFVKLTGTSGALVTLGTGSTIQNMGFVQLTNTTGATQVIGCGNGCSGSLRNIFIYSQSTISTALDLISVSHAAAQIFARNLYVQRAGSGANVTNIAVATGVLVLHEFRSYPGSSQTANLSVAGGVLYGFDGRLEPAATTDIVQTGGTVRLERVQYVTESGTVSNGARARADATITDSIRVTATCTPASATAACTTGDQCWDASFHYQCIATNTWVRAALSTW